MLIDWFTVAAQALNFLILVWLMKRFLYRPVLKAIDAREKLVATELADAAAKKSDAQKDRDEFQHKNEVFAQERAALLAKATGEAIAERQRLIEEARKAADGLSAKRAESLQNELAELTREIGDRTRQQVFAIVQKTLADLAGANLEERIVEVFTRRLRTLDAPAKVTLGSALKTASPALVRSAFELPEQQKAAIQNSVNETFSADIRLQFETAPQLVSGIELSANGQKLAWSIADYLASLEKSIGELIAEKNPPETKPVVKANPKTKPEPPPPVNNAVKVEPPKLVPAGK